jgi:hypothetical protein
MIRRLSFSVVSRSRTGISTTLGLGCTSSAATSTRTSSLTKKQQHNLQQQVRFHRTDYGGPGKFDERETGTKAFDEAARSHDNNEHHSHSHHHHHHQAIDTNDKKHNSIEEEKKEQLQQLLQARYDRRSGSYARRGYTIGIGGPGEIR